MTSQRPMRTAPSGPKKEPVSQGHYNKLTSLGVVTDVVEAALKRHFNEMKVYIDSKLEKVDERLESMEGQLEYYFSNHEDDAHSEEKNDVGVSRVVVGPVMSATYAQFTFGLAFLSFSSVLLHYTAQPRR